MYHPFEVGFWTAAGVVCGAVLYLGACIGVLLLLIDVVNWCKSFISKAVAKLKKAIRKKKV